jgi:hypothetical protein
MNNNKPLVYFFIPSLAFFTIFAFVVILTNGIKRLSRNNELPIDHATASWLSAS